MIHTQTDEAPASTELMAPELSIADVMQQREFQFFTITANGIDFKENCPEETWQELMRNLFNAHSATEESLARTKARIGDACNFGEALYGERWSQVLPDVRAHFGITEKSASNLMWICKKVAPERRHIDTLTISHLEIVAKLSEDEQEKWLTKAEKEQWTVSELKEEVKKKHGKPRVKKNSASTDNDEKPPTEEEALEAAETILRFFESAEEEDKDGPLRTWGKVRLNKHNDALHPLEMIAKRVRVALKKCK